jgi:hypothetical protein
VLATLDSPGIARSDENGQSEALRGWSRAVIWLTATMRGKTVQARRPAITALAILAALAGLAHIVAGLQSFGVLPAAGGAGAAFFIWNPTAGVIQLAAALFTLALAYGLWQRQSWSRTALVIIAAANLVIIFATQFGGDRSWWNAVPGIVLNAALLLYARTPAVRQEFDR